MAETKTENSRKSVKTGTDSNPVLLMVELNEETSNRVFEILQDWETNLQECSYVLRLLM